jgi:flagellar basal-body rod modification protein FlgD
MTGIATTQDPYAAVGLTTSTTAQAAAQAAAVNPQPQKLDFLTLMTAQIKNQDPLNPMNGTDFLAQLAQFSVVDQLTQLNTAFGQLSSRLVSDQSLQAAALIGRTAQVSSSTGSLEAGGALSGAAVLGDPAADLRINIYDQAGVPVRSLDLGSQSAGQIPFFWDGMISAGIQAAPGTYRIEALADTAGGTQSLETLVNARVESVSTGASSGELTVDLAGVGAVPYSDVLALN